jgi:hypothetical protein
MPILRSLTGVRYMPPEDPATSSGPGDRATSS